MAELNQYCILLHFSTIVNKKPIQKCFINPLISSRTKPRKYINAQNQVLTQQINAKRKTNQWLNKYHKPHKSKEKSNIACLFNSLNAQDIYYHLFKWQPNQW